MHGWRTISAEARRTCERQHRLRCWRNGAADGGYGRLSADRPAPAAPRRQRRSIEDRSLSGSPHVASTCSSTYLEGASCSYSSTGKATARPYFKYQPNPEVGSHHGREYQLDSSGLRIASNPCRHSVYRVGFCDRLVVGS